MLAVYNNRRTVKLTPRCTLSSDFVIEMLDKAIDMSAHKPAYRIIFQRDAGRAALDPSRGDLDWNEEMQRIRLAGKQFKDYVPVESNHPLYILYTSGTTGLPKVLIRRLRNMRSIRGYFYLGANNIWSCPHWMNFRGLFATTEGMLLKRWLL